MRYIAAFLLAAVAPSLVQANTGVFAGSGHTIKLVRSEDVQLRSEKVTITPRRGSFPFIDGGIDRVEFRCKFVLHNRSKKPVSIQVGFPLTASSIAGQKSEDATALVFSYKFIVRDQQNTYHVRFEPQDVERKFAAIFLWDMTFRADEVRELNVAYETPMSTAMTETEETPGIKYAKDWYLKLSACVVEWFDYVTETGRSWAGPIEDATFELHVGEFEEFLSIRFANEEPSLKGKERTLVEKERKAVVDEIEKLITDGETNRQSDVQIRGLRSSIAKLVLFDWRVKERLIHRDVEPNGWKYTDGVIRWEFKNYRPTEAVGVTYMLTALPRYADGVSPFIRAVLGDTPRKEDLNDLREILLAWWGIEPKSKAVRTFVTNQRWYSPKDGMTIDKLTAEQKAVISAIEQYH